MQTDQEIIDYVTRRLGGGVVGVELTNDQMLDCLEDGKAFFQTYLEQTKVHLIQGVNNGGEFDMPNDCDVVVEVVFDVQDATLYDQFDWAGVELGPLNFGMYGGYRSNGAGGGYSYLMQALQYREQAKRMLGTDRDWIWDRDKRKLILTPTSRGGRGIGNMVEVRYAVNEIDVTLLRPYEYSLLKRWVLAEAMEALGHIRTKYGELPSASGSLSLNGDTMFSNSETIKMNVMDKIKTLRAPIPPFAN